MIRFVLLGEPASKANSRQVALDTSTGRRRVIKSDKALHYVESALRQIPPKARQQLKGDIAIELRIFYASRRPDLDESLVLDCLQDQFTSLNGKRYLAQRGVYCNDRQVKEKHVFHAIDRCNPRTEVLITEIES